MSLLRTRERKTWADRQSIPTGIYGEKWENILICENNRATVYEFDRPGIEQLIDYKNRNYRTKGVHAVIFGVDDGKQIKYAVFVKSGFLRYVSEDEDFNRRHRGTTSATKAEAKTNRAK